MRLLAWRLVPRPGRTRELWNPWDCDLCCPGGEWDDDRRASMGCTRSDLEPVLWQLEPKRIASVGAYTGRPADPGITNVAGYRCSPKYPVEDPDEGCPAGFVHSTLARWVYPMLRTRTEVGGRVPNPLLDDCADPLVHALVIEYEREEERCLAHRRMLENSN